MGKGLSKGTKLEKIALNDKQIKDLLKYVKNLEKKHNERDYLLILTWFHVGFRVSEISNFMVDWLEDRDNTKFINIKENSKPISFKPKYGSVRRIPIPDNLYKKLTRYLGGRKTGYVFKSQKKTSYGMLNKRYIGSLVNDYFKQVPSIGRNLGTHTLRRTFASQLQHSNPPVGIRRIQTYLGHKNLQTTIKYLKQITTDDHSAILENEYISNLSIE